MAKKSKKTSRTPKAELDAGAEFMAKVRMLPCAVRDWRCQGPIVAHHITIGGRRIDDFHTIPLCDGFHHSRGNGSFGYSVHNGSKLFEKNYKPQMELLEETRAKIEKGLHKCRTHFGEF